MGAADVVPGVSGGTVAFITGIYEELIASIRSFDGGALKLLVKFDLKPLLAHVNGLFLAALFAGILTSVLTLSRAIIYCLKNYPEMLWAFFFGLIIASALVVSKKIGRWSPSAIVGGILGVLFGYAVTIAVPVQTPEALWFVFLSGMIAICAMILPGISGSFILVLLAKYEFVLAAVKEFNLLVIGVFSCGCAVGLLSFSHLLNWTLKRFYDVTIAVLTGIMIGSLNKVWPWKKVIGTYINSRGEVKPLQVENILPFEYLEATGRDPYLMQGIGLCVFGFLLVLGIEKISRKHTETETNNKES